MLRASYLAFNQGLEQVHLYNARFSEPISLARGLQTLRPRLVNC